jgi:hypothetical protein
MERRRVRGRRRRELARPLLDACAREERMLAVPLEEAPAECVDVDECDALVRREQRLDEAGELRERARQSSRSTG